MKNIYNICFICLFRPNIIHILCVANNCCVLFPRLFWVNKFCALYTWVIIVLWPIINVFFLYLMSVLPFASVPGPIDCVTPPLSLCDCAYAVGVWCIHKRDLDFEVKIEIESFWLTVSLPRQDGLSILTVTETLILSLVKPRPRLGHFWDTM